MQGMKSCLHSLPSSVNEIVVYELTCANVNKYSLLAPNWESFQILWLEQSHCPIWYQDISWQDQYQYSHGKGGSPRPEA